MKRRWSTGKEPALRPCRRLKPYGRIVYVEASPQSWHVAPKGGVPGNWNITYLCMYVICTSVGTGCVVWWWLLRRCSNHQPLYMDI